MTRCKCGEPLWDNQEECYDCARDMDNDLNSEWYKGWMKRIK